MVWQKFYQTCFRKSCWLSICPIDLFITNALKSADSRPYIAWSFLFIILFFELLQAFYAFRAWFDATVLAIVVEPNVYCGKVSECIRKNLRPGSYDFYLCGERKMIREVTLLVDENYQGSRIYTEVFFWICFWLDSNLRTIRHFLQHRH